MAAVATTPPPTSSINTPSTPKFGWEDDYQPYAPRKSARISSQRTRITQTPPPPDSISQKTRKNRISTPATGRRATTTSTYDPQRSPPSSPQDTPKSRSSKQSNSFGRRTVSGALSAESAASAARSLGLSNEDTDAKMDSMSSTKPLRQNGMLPTPAKTPRKRHSENPGGINAIARNLFSSRPETVDEVMPTPKRKGRKYKGYTLDSFAPEEDPPIQIYTDSQDRVPVVDTSLENPFYGPTSSSVPEPRKRESKRRKISIPGEGQQTLEEAEKREDGLIYVFRGKKIFRKFADEDDKALTTGDSYEDELDAELEKTVPEHLRESLTRSSIKPRLLFPPAKKEEQRVTTDDEEAVTDIEEQSAGFATPLAHEDEDIDTPKAPRFGQLSPPTTTRRVRKFDRNVSPIPMANAASETAEWDSLDNTTSRTTRAGRGKTSPFDAWSRTKSGGGGGASERGKKREGESLVKPGSESGKRTRGRAV